MGQEINLLKSFPKVDRDISERVKQKSLLEKAIARQFDRDFFDGDRRYGYGGYYYHPKYWEAVAKDLQQQYHLNDKSAVLDVGCAKGFLLFELQKLIPKMRIAGIDISYYAISQAPKQVRPFLQVADARDLPFVDNQFDLVLSLNTIHNFEGEDLKTSLREIERVSTKNSFITVDAFHSNHEKELLEQWVLTARSILHVDDWKSLFNEVGYTGDYYWFTL